MSQLRKREILKSYFANRYEKVLDSLLVADTTAAAAAVVGGENGLNKVPNREVVHGIASSLFNASIERLKPGKDDLYPLDLEDATGGSDEFWKDENFKQEIESDTRLTAMETVEKSAGKLESKAKEHFLDIFVEKLITKMVKERLPEREHFGELTDEEKRKSQTISATILTNNLKKLTPKMGGIFEVQDSVVRLLTWRNPSGTVIMLLILTMIFYNPMHLIMMPLLYIMYGLMIPGYMRRHPLRRTLYPARRVYGKSLLKEVANGGPSTAWHPAGAIQEFAINTPTSESDNSETEKNLNNGVEFVANMRDFQNATTATLAFSDSIERFIYGTAGFKDEKQSTVVFLKYFTSFLVLGLLSRFVNWSFVISFALWYTMLTTHPKIRPKLSALSKSEKPDPNEKVQKESESYNVILDEPPEVKLVEIYEIYEQGITPRHWSFYKLSNQVFDPLDQYRKLQHPPPGVSELKDVLPPKTWLFDENSKWQVDFNVQKWASERGLHLSIQDEFLVDDAFKRRRLTRRVLRYANPARKPSYKYA